MKSFKKSAKRKWFIVPFMLFSVLQSYGQSKDQARGTVLDQHGKPLQGVTITAIDMQGREVSHVASDSKGQFALQTLNNGENYTLRFKMVGYKNYEEKNFLIKSNDSNSLLVRLKDNISDLEEVVVVGYGTQKKSLVTGSVAQVNGKELRTAPTANLSSMLQGRLAGLVSKQSSGQPGADGANFLVRGYNSTSSSSPLIIVDGFERPFPNVNPDEIESISILKDAAAAAVYGVRGANGVILITTRRGSNQKPTVTFNSSLALSANTNFPEFLDGSGYAYWYDKAQEMDNVPADARRFTPEMLNKINNGDPDGVFGNTNWFDLLFNKTAPIYTNNLSLDGGSDRYKYFVSLGSYNQQGIINNTSYKRYSGRTNLDAKVTDNFDIALNISARDDKQLEPGLSAGVGNTYASIFSQAMMSYPFLLPFTSDGKYVGSLNSGNSNQNPIAARDLSGSQNTGNFRFQSNLALTYNVPFLSGLKLKVNGSLDKGTTMKKTALLPYLLAVYNNSNSKFTDTYARHAPSGMAQVNQWYSGSWMKSMVSSIGYDKQFNKHGLSALFLYEYKENGTESLSSGKRGYPITDIMDIDFGDEIIETLIKGGHSNFKRAGYASRISYNYAEKYLLELTGRLDGSQKFAKDFRWGFFPGLAAGWRISSEPFFKDNVAFVNDLKIRLSVGKLGNDNITDFSYLPTAKMGVDPVVMIGSKTQRALALAGVPNESLSWETTMVYNGGLEATLWNNLLAIDGDVFYRVTSNILQPLGNKPPSLGGYFPSYVNAGKVDSRGFELILKHNHHIGNFQYQVKGNVSWARNKIIEANDDINLPDHLRTVGQRIGRKYGFVADGLFQSQAEIDNSALFSPTTRVGEIKLRDLNGDGKITWEQDWTVIGRSDMPELMFGLNLGGAYKNFDFNAFLQGAALSDVALSGLYGTGVYDNTFFTMPFYQDGNTPKHLVEGAWTPENTDAKYPRLSANPIQSGGKFSSWWIKDGAYLRLKSVQLGYTLPDLMTKRIGLQSARFHVSGSNLFTISGLGYYDPEMPSVNQGYYPQQKLYEFGLSVTF